MAAGDLLAPAWRAVLAGGTSLAVVLVLGRWLIPLFAARQIVEETRKGDSLRLDELHAAKRHTPTLGGLIILAGLAAATLAWTRPGDRHALVLLACAAALGALGLADDLKKLRRGKGIRPRVKLCGQLALGLAAGAYLALFPLEIARSEGTAAGGTTFFIPFAGGSGIDLGWAFPLLIALVTTAASNAVNLTDGLDGLAAGTSLAVALALAAIALVVAAGGEPAGVPAAAGAGEVGVFLAALAGACLGFLRFNAHPARVFMGDTGSLAIGGALGLAAILLKQETFLVVAGGVLVVEALSVIIQVASFKCTGRRVFLCSPLHHHFQFKGWPETRITARFWIAGAALAVAAVTAWTYGAGGAR
jgi:phospho-N-acetylmuramoyl-pentapeptide-transferase